MDLNIDEGLILQHPLQVYSAKVTLKHPIPPKTIGIILPRQAVTLNNKFVSPGVIVDPTVTVLYLEVWASQSDFFRAGDTIAQLLLLHQGHLPVPPLESVAVAMPVIQITEERPRLSLAMGGTINSGID